MDIRSRWGKKKKRFVICGWLCLLFGCALGSVVYSWNHREPEKRLSGEPRKDENSQAVQTMVDAGADAVAAIIRDGETATYPSLAEAVTEAKSGDTITLIKDCPVEKQIKVEKKDITITAEGPYKIIDHIPFADATSMIQIGNGAKLTLSGKVVCQGAAKVTADESAIKASMIDTEGKSTSVSYAVFVIKDEVQLTGHACGNTSNGGAVTLGNYARMTMTGGKILYNYTEGSGGAVYQAADSQFELKGGVLQNNTAKANGGAVNVLQNAKFKFNVDLVEDATPATICNNIANNGSAVYIASKAEAVMDKGEIRANTSSNQGAVYLAGTFTMNDGTISENSAQSGGGIYVDKSASLKLYGGDIVDNCTNSDFGYGGGIYDNGNLNLKGKVTVTGNTINGGAGSNLSVQGSTNTITIDDALNSATKIGVTKPSGTVGKFATIPRGLNVNDNFTADQYNYGIGTNESSSYVYIGYRVRFDKNDPKSATAKWEDGEEYHEVIVESTGTIPEFPKVSCERYYQDETNGKAWYVDGQNGSPKYITKNDSISAYNSVDGVITVKAAWTLLIATVERNNEVIGKYAAVNTAINAAVSGDSIVIHADANVGAVIPIDKNISIKSEAGHTYTLSRGNRNLFFSVNDGLLSLENINLDGGAYGYSLVKVNGGTFRIGEGAKLYNMNFANTTPSESTGFGAVYVVKGSMYLNGGLIEKNAMNGNGGAVYMKDGDFTMTAGEIKDNSASSGAGIYLYGGNFTMTGGSITGNNATMSDHKGDGVYANVDITLGGTAQVIHNGPEGNVKSNVYLGAGKLIKVTAQAPFESEANIGITMEDPSVGYFTKGLKDNGTEANFSSDSSAYGLGMQEGEAYLGYKVTFHAGGGRFKDDPDNNTKEMVVIAGNCVKLPVVYCSGQGFVKWTYQVSGVTQDFTESTPVISNVDVTANWDVVNCYIGDNGYYSLATALHDAEENDTITLTNSIKIAKTMEVDKKVTIAGDANTLSLDTDSVMFLVKSENAKLTFHNIILDGKQHGASLIQCDAGEVVIDEDAKLTGVANPSASNGAGNGVVYVKGGKVTLKGGTISDNTTWSAGGAVYVEKGEFDLAGGSIVNNESVNEGAGVYIGVDGCAVLKYGNITNNKSQNALGSGIYVAGNLTIEGVASKKLIVQDNDANNIYLQADKTITFSKESEPLTEQSKLYVTLNQPKQGVFTSGMKDKAVCSEDKEQSNLISENEGYTLATDEKGEAYIGWKIVFDTNGGYFASEEEVDPDQRVTQQEKVVIENHTVLLPEVRNGEKAVEGWFTSDGFEELKKDTKVTKTMHVFAQWTDAVCHIGKTYYASVENAVYAGRNSGLDEKVTIELLCSSILKETALIDYPVVLTSEEGNSYRISRGDNLVMFRTKDAGELTLQNVTLAGNNKSYAMIQIDSGTVNIKDGTNITGCVNGVNNENTLDVSGPGTVYLGEKGKLNMTGGMISGNTPARGGGVYMSGGTFRMSGGSIEANQLSDRASVFGGGVYFGKGTLDVSSEAQIAGNKLADGTPQNVYYIVGTTILKMSEPLKNEKQIGVTPSVMPTGITTDLMTDVTDTLKPQTMENYVANSIFSDLEASETIVDFDSFKIRLRYGHTVKFAAEPGKLVGEASIDVLHNKNIETMPTAQLAGKYFDGWFSEDGIRVNEYTNIEKSMTLYARFTIDRCATPVAEPKGDTYYGEKKEITLSCPTAGSRIYYTVDGTEPTEESSEYKEPIVLTDHAVLHAIAVKDEWSDSAVLEEEYKVYYVKTISFLETPNTVFRGYDSSFSAKVVTGNSSTPDNVSWMLIGDHDEDTTIQPSGKLMVSLKETAEQLTIRAVSADPSIYKDITVPVRSQYTMTYDKNAPKDRTVTGSMTDSSSPYLEESTVTVLQNAYACSGYTFQGWNTAADGSGTAYKAEDTFVISANTVLYAQWEPVISVKNVSITPTKVTVAQGENYPFLAEVKGSGNLKGTVTWSIKGQKSEETKISDTGVLTIGVDEAAETVTVTAMSDDDVTMWSTATVTVKELLRCKVAYSSMGGTGTMTDEQSPYIAGESVTLKECSFTRDGYDFMCWNTSANGQGYSLLPGDTYLLHQDTVFYAQWKRNGMVLEEEEKKEVTPEPSVKSDEEYARETIALIDAIGDVTKDSGSAIAAARKSYDALTPAQKALIDAKEYQKLQLREMLYQNLVSPGQSSAPVQQQPQALPVTNTKSGSVKPLAKGKTFTVGKYKYKVTVSLKSKGEVTLYKPLKKNYKTVVIPSSVTYKKVKYKVTAISANAFKNNKKLTKVTIGSNVKTIGSSAFYGTTHCKAFTVKSRKIKTIGKKAFCKIGSYAYIKMPDSKYRTYEKLLKNGRKDRDVRLKTY